MHADGDHPKTSSVNIKTGIIIITNCDLVSEILSSEWLEKTLYLNLK